MTSSAMSNIGWCKSMRDVFTLLGLDADAIFVEAGMVHSIENSGSLGDISDAFTRAWEIAVEQAGDASIGLTVPSHPIRSLGALSHLVIASTAVLPALDKLIRYVHMVSPTVTVSYQMKGESCLIELDLMAGRLPVATQRYDCMAVTLVRTLQWLTGRRIQPLQVFMPYAAPARADRWRDALGAPVMFGAKTFALEFVASDMTSLIPTADPVVAEMCERLVIQAVGRTSSSISSKVRQVLVGMLPEGDPRREAVAAKLSMSERTLQRRLTEENTSFAELVDEVRRETAERYLQHGNFTPTELSFALGFSDPSTFYRACKRWFGRSPRMMQATGRTPDTISTF